MINIAEFGARKMKYQRRKKRWHKTSYKSRVLKLRERKDPLQGAPMAKGIVLSKVGREQKQPSSGIIKCVRVQLLKNGKEITAFVPGNGAIDKIKEHDEILVAGLGGSQHGAIGSMWGVSWKVVQVNGVSLDALLKGKAKGAGGAPAAK